MSRTDTFRTIQDYPDTLPKATIHGAHRGVTIDGHPIEGRVDLPKSPLVTVITPSFNSAATIGRTIQSVRQQTYRNIEYIVIDGGSSDATLEKIIENEEHISYWHSSPDKGISDAFNAGVSVSKGHLIAIVNSDDWLSPDQIEQSVLAIRRTGADFSFGDMVFFSGDVPLYKVKGSQDYASSFRTGNAPTNHPTVVASRAIYEDIGLFDLRWKVAMDYDWLYRSHRAGYRGTYTPKVCSNMSDGGISNTEYWQVYRESWEISRDGGLCLGHAVPIYVFRYSKTTIRRFLEAIFGKRRIARIRTSTNSLHQNVQHSKSDY